MNKTETIKKFDCVKEVRKVRDQIADDVNGMSPAEIVKYFSKKAKSLK